MATTRPRLTVTLRQSSQAVLAELSMLTGQSQSAILCDLLEQAEPILVRTVKLLRAADRVSKEARIRVVEGLQDAQDVLERQLGLFNIHDRVDLQSTFDEELVDIVARRARAPGRAAPGLGPLAPAQTPPSNRGVTNPRSDGKRQVKATGRRGKQGARKGGRG